MREKSPRRRIPSQATAPPQLATHLLHEVAEEDGLLPQRVMHQPIREEDHALWEVVLGQPGNHPLLLHVRPPRDVEDHVAQVLPVPGKRALQHPAPPQSIRCPGVCPACCLPKPEGLLQGALRKTRGIPKSILPCEPLSPGQLSWMAHRHQVLRATMVPDFAPLCPCPFSWCCQCHSNFWNQR